GARSGSGDGADEPDDPGRRKPLRSHETETSNQGGRLMRNPGAEDDTSTDLQNERRCKSSEREDCASMIRKGRSCSHSNNNNGRTTRDLVQRSESGPAQTRHPTSSDDDRPVPEDGSTDDICLRLALIRRSSMVKASDITGEPTVDAPWVHHLRPTLLLALGRGSEGYGGYGKLPKLPDADHPSTIDNQRVATNTLLSRHKTSATDPEIVRDGRSFSFASSDEIISQHTALTEDPPKEFDSANSLQDLSSATAPTESGTRSHAHVEGCQPRRPFTSRIIPQVLSASVSALGDVDLPTYGRSQTGTTPHSIFTGSRRGQARSWSSVLCCIGDSGLEGRSSSESERSSSDTEPRRHSGNQDTEAQGNSLEQTFASARQHPGTHSSIPERNFAATDGLDIPQAMKWKEPQPYPAAVEGSTGSIRARSAKNNERWRDPRPRDEHSKVALQGPQPSPPADGDDVSDS
ncbi:MAG: hypothetical protein M1830_010580, partial [Pleopsidium flavum]